MKIINNIIFTILFLVLFIKSSHQQSYSISKQIETFNVGGYIFSSGRFGDGSIPLTFSVIIDDDNNNKKNIEIKFINSTYFEGIAPSGLSGFQDIEISFEDTQLYLAKNMIHIVEASTPVFIQKEMSVYGYNKNVSGYGYFGETNQTDLVFTISQGSESQKINITYIDKYYFEGVVGPDLTCYQDVTIFNKSKEIYKAENIALFVDFLNPASDCEFNSASIIYSTLSTLLFLIVSLVILF